MEKIGKSIVFSMVAFVPVVIFFLFFMLGVLVNIMINVSFGLSLLLWFLISLILFLLLSSLCYLLCRLNDSWAIRGLIIYGFWLIIGTAISYLLLSAIGGTSMAYTEGAVSGRSFQGQVLGNIPALLLLGHIIIIPWTIISILIMKRLKTDIL